MTPCRVRSRPSVSCTNDRGFLSLRRATSWSRVASPSAAKTGTEPVAALATDMSSNIRGLQFPAFRARTQDFQPL